MVPQNRVRYTRHVCHIKYHPGTSPTLETSRNFDYSRYTRQLVQIHCIGCFRDRGPLVGANRCKILRITECIKDSLHLRHTCWSDPLLLHFEVWPFGRPRVGCTKNEKTKIMYSTVPLFDIETHFVKSNLLHSVRSFNDLDSHQTPL